jgi:SAM-dependent methyltransferase
MDSSDWDQRYAGTELVWSVEPNAWVEGIAGALPPGRALDLAAGEGRNALWLVEHGWTATAVDFSPIAIERAAAIAAERFGTGDGRFVAECADVLEYQAHERHYDLVLVIYLHLPAAQRARVLRKAAGAVAPGGLLLVVAHDSSNRTEGIGGPQDPELLYTAEDVADDLVASGLTVERSETVERPVQTDDGQRMARDAIFIGHRPRTP